MIKFNIHKTLLLLITLLGLVTQLIAQELGDYEIGQDFSNTDHVGCRAFMPFQSGNNFILVQLDDQTKVIGITYAFESKDSAEELAAKYLSEYRFKKNVFFWDIKNIRYATQKLSNYYSVVVVDMSKKDQVISSFKGEVSVPKIVTDRINSIGGLWELDQFVDEFGDKVGERYSALPPVNGIFSNSATSGSNMRAKLIVTRNKIMFKLLEYDDVPVAGDDYFEILIKDSEGEKTSIIGKQDNRYIVSTNDSRTSQTKDNYTKFKSLLEKGGEMQIVIKGQYGEMYKFSLNVDGFVDIFPTRRCG